MKQPRGLCIDISGILHEHGETVTGAGAAITRVRDAGVPIRFLANTSRKPSSAVLDKLRDPGFETGEDLVLTACTWMPGPSFVPWNMPPGISTISSR